MFHLFSTLQKKVDHVLGPLFLKIIKTSSNKKNRPRPIILLLIQKSGDHDLGCQTNPVVKKWEKLPTATGDRQEFGKPSTVPELPNSNPVTPWLFQHTPKTYITPHPQPTHYQNQFRSFWGFEDARNVCLSTGTWKKIELGTLRIISFWKDICSFYRPLVGFFCYPPEIISLPPYLPPALLRKHRFFWLPFRMDLFPLKGRPPAPSSPSGCYNFLVP